MATKVLHLTTVHPIDDVRVFRKEVRSLREAGFDVTVAGIRSGELPSDIEPAVIFEQISSRWRRVMTSWSRAIKVCEAERPDILHFHDPEILAVLPFVRRSCGIIIYDSHECLSEAVYHKDYLPRIFRPFVSVVVGWVEKIFIRFADGLVVPTPHIAEYFRLSGKPLVQIANYPETTSLPALEAFELRSPRAVYTGGLAFVRGLKQMVQGAEEAGIVLDLAGPADGDGSRFLKSVQATNIHTHGQISHSRALALQAGAMVGMSLLMPRKQYLNAIPTKVFEFLASGLAVICSDFPFLRRLFSGFHGIYFVNPEDSSQVAAAMQEAIRNYPSMSHQLLENRQRVLRQFTWEGESARLGMFYQTLLKQRSCPETDRASVT